MSQPVRRALLALHTTEAVGSVAVRHGSRVAAREFVARGQHAPVLLGSVQQVLAEARVGWDALQGIVVSTGPGSFTGIRVGLATAQGLAAARGWRVSCCDSLVAAAAARTGGLTPLGIVQDARRGEVFAALYDARAAAPRPLVMPFCATPAAAAQRLARAATEVGATALVVVGSGSALVREPLRACGLDAETPHEDPSPNVARALLALTDAGGTRQVAPEELEPTYLRKSDAEIRRDMAPQHP